MKHYSNIRSYAVGGEIENDADTSENRDLAADEIELLRQCRQLLEDNQEKDPKYKEVRQYLIDKCWLEKGCIIFSQYYDSVMWLATKLFLSETEKLLILRTSW